LPGRADRENGSGKTSGSGQILAKKYLENGFGGLVLCFKTMKRIFGDHI
jgi:hypothetical protein